MCQTCKLKWLRNGTLAISHSGVCTSSTSTICPMWWFPARCVLQEGTWVSHCFRCHCYRSLMSWRLFRVRTEVICLKKCWGDPPHDVTWCDFRALFVLIPKKALGTIRMWQTKSCFDEINSKQMEIFQMPMAPWLGPDSSIDRLSERLPMVRSQRQSRRTCATWSSCILTKTFVRRD